MEVEAWKPVDSSWQTAAEPWVVVHDLYHHLPGDGGSFEEELRTLGAQYYVDFGPPGPHDTECLPGQRAIERAASSIVAMVVEAKGPCALQVSTRSVPKQDTFAEMVFAAAAASAKLEFDSTFPTQTNDSDVEDARACFADVERLTACVREGYALAAQRFPDREAVRKGRDAAQAALDKLTNTSKPGDQLKCVLQGYNTQFTCSQALD